jgi:uncharacterized membrane protein
LSKLGEAKTLGGIGSILLLIPGVSIVGYILILVATKYISDDLGDRSIFSNILYAVISGIVGALAAVVIFFAGFLSSLFTLGSGAVLGLVAGLAVAWISIILSSIFIRRAFDTIGTRLNNNSFKTAGMLYFIGALLVIVFVGFIILFVAYIFMIIAFFSIQEGQPQMQAQPSSAPMAQAGTRFCPNCGSQVGPSVTFCPKCGAKLPV